jgi:rhodanese-related sulfurtransferase
MSQISRDELKAKLDRGDEFKLIMVMGEWAFKAQHIPGSINMNSAMEARSIPRDTEIVVYCTGGACFASKTAYTVLLGMGFTNVWHYAGGLEDWVAADYPLEGEMIESSEG